MEYSYFHWALHPWAIYAIVGLALAYFVHRKGAPNLISSAFRPILGDRVEGPIGRSIDGLAIFATLFGSATSLGLGALQINSGMNFLWDVEVSNGFAVAIIAALTAMFIVSAVSGVHRGVQWLSNGNMVLAVLLLTFLLVVGPTVFIFDTLAASVGGYVSSIVPRSFQTGAFGDQEWLAGWTIFYWAWWISWAPFVGTFIARISRGRTIGQFVLGVMLIPSGVSFVWFAILGGAAIDLQLNGTDIAGAVAQAPEIGLFTTLEQFPLADLTTLVVIVLVALFFISGADAASLVMGMLSSHGAMNPPRAITIFWGVAMGAAASILLLAGGLEALQQASIIAAAPFLLVMIGLCVALYKALSRDEALAQPAAPATVVTQRTAAERRRPGGRGGAHAVLIVLGRAAVGPAAARRGAAGRRPASRPDARANVGCGAHCSRMPGTTRPGTGRLRPVELARRRGAGAPPAAEPEPRGHTTRYDLTPVTRVKSLPRQRERAGATAPASCRPCPGSRRSRPRPRPPGPPCRRRSPWRRPPGPRS